MRGDVRYWHKPDLPECPLLVRYQRQSRHRASGRQHECAVAQERVAKILTDMLGEQRRLQAAEDLVTELKRELNEIKQAKDRRRWW